MRLFKKIYNYIKQFILEEYKLLVVLFCLYIIFTWPVNYYIIIGGGISDVDDRIVVEDEYDSKGSFNISYVSELQGRVGSYLLSYVIPDWKRVSIDDFKYDAEENLEDVEFRSDLDLKTANATAVYYAYHLAGKSIETVKSQIYIIATFEEYKTKLKVQDELININGKKFSTISQYRKYMQTLDAKDPVEVRVLRDGKEQTISCSIYDYKGNNILGVSLQEVVTYKTDPSVKFNFREAESGPSGGLITTLEIYNNITKKDLTNSLKIAGTGTVESDGSVGEIGEVQYKLLGAVSGGADVFLVPKGDNYKTCQKVAKEKKLKIKIIGVSTVEDAIEQLQKLK